MFDTTEAEQELVTLTAVFLVAALTHFILMAERLDRKALAVTVY
jgi:hypothetical protein